MNTQFHLIPADSNRKFPILIKDTEFELALGDVIELTVGPDPEQFEVVAIVENKAKAVIRYDLINYNPKRQSNGG